jgi:MraZ protein
MVEKRTQGALLKLSQTFIYKIRRKYRSKGGKNMFSGEFKHSLDTKNRLFIPAKHRDELGESFMVAKSIRENCLKVYSMQEWEEYISPILKMERKASEAILRALHRDASQVSPDSQGRIVIPASLVEYAGITKGAVVVGCGKYAEIWSEENYEAMVGAENIEDIKNLLESYGL